MNFGFPVHFRAESLRTYSLNLNLSVIFIRVKSQWNERWMNLGEIFNTATVCKFEKSIEESFGFSFSKLFTGNLNKAELICLLVWTWTEQDNKIMRDKDKLTRDLSFPGLPFPFHER